MKKRLLAGLGTLCVIFFFFGISVMNLSGRAVSSSPPVISTHPNSLFISSLESFGWVVGSLYVLILIYSLIFHHRRKKSNEVLTEDRL